MNHAFKPALWLAGVLSSFLWAGMTSAAIPPLDIRIVAKYDLPNQLAGTYGAISGNYLYINNEGFTVIDIHNPAAPQMVAHLGVGAGFVGPALAGTLACQLGGNQLSVFDVKNPLAPALLGTLTNIDGAALATYDHYALVVGSNLRIVDIADPAKPAVVGMLPLQTIQNGGFPIQVSGHYAYTTRDPGYIAVVDLGDPNRPIAVASIPGARGSALAIHDTTLYYFDGMPNNSGIRACDISDPLQPKPIGSLLRVLPSATANETYPSMAGLIDGGLVSIDQIRLQVTSLDRETNAAFSGMFQPQGPRPGEYQTLYLFATRGRYAYLKVEGPRSDGSVGTQLWVADLGTPSTYLPVNQFQSARIAGFEGTSAFLSTLGQLYNTPDGVEMDPYPPLVSVDLGNPISAPTVPTNLPSFIDSSSVDSLAVNRGKGAAIVDKSTLVLYDLTSDHSPRIATAIPYQDFGTSLGNLAGGPAFAADSTMAIVTDLAPRLWRVNIADLNHPAIVNQYDATTAPINGRRIGSLALAAPWLYVTVDYSIQVFDVGGNTNFARVGGLAMDLPPSKLIIAGNVLAALGTPPGGITFYSLTNPASPALLSVYQGNAIYTDGCVAGKYLYAAIKEFGIDVFDLSAQPITRVAGNTTVCARGLFSNGRVLTATSLASNSYGLGLSTVLPLFDQSPAYTPFGQAVRPDGFRFNLRGIPGTTARLQRSSMLGVWNDWKTVSFATNSVSVTDADSAGKGQFYRVIAP